MVCGMSELQAEVEGFASGEKIAPAAHKKIWDEIVESEEFVDMQLAIEVRMAKRIRDKLRMQLDNFDPAILAAECMFEDDEAESGMRGLGSFVDADSDLAEEIASERARGLKKAGAKALSAEDLTVLQSNSGKATAAAVVSDEASEAEAAERTHPVGAETIDLPAQQQALGEMVVINEAQAVAEGRVGGRQPEEAGGLAGVTFSADNSGELLPVNVGQHGESGTPTVVASEEIFEGCTGRIE